MPVIFDTYREDRDRRLMVSFVMRQRCMDERRAIEELRTLNLVGLAYVYADAMRMWRDDAWHRVDYDPLPIGGR